MDIWGKIAKLDFDDRRRRNNGQTTGKELFSKAVKQMESAEQIKEWREEIEPLMKSHLLDHMVNKKPIKVLTPIKNPTEGIAGQKDEDDDGFYASKSSTSVGSFEEFMETIPSGSELIYKSWNKSLGQWIFQDTDSGREYAIYEQPKVMFQGRQIENPGFFGLLHNTNIRELIKE